MLIRSCIGGDLTLHSLPTLALLSSFASQSRGAASLFVLSTYIHQPPAAPPRRSNTNARATAAINVPQSSPEVRTTLALACRRKLVLLSWIDGAWQSPAEVSLPHQIRGMAFDERRIVAGFSTGEYGIVALPPAKAASGDVPTLGELFSLPLPVVEKPKVPAGGLGGLGNVMGLGALGGLSLGPKKLEKNGVVAVPRFGKGKGREESGKGKDGAGWLWGKEWGWEDDEPEAKEGEVFVVRESESSVCAGAGSAPLTLIHLRRHGHPPHFLRQAPPFHLSTAFRRLPFVGGRDSGRLAICRFPPRSTSHTGTRVNPV